MRLSGHSPGPVPCLLTFLKEEKGFQATRFTPRHRFHLSAAQFTHGLADGMVLCLAVSDTGPGSGRATGTVQARPAGRQMRGGRASRGRDSEPRPNTCRGKETLQAPPTRSALELGLHPNATDSTKDKSPKLKIKPGGKSHFLRATNIRVRASFYPRVARGALESGHVTRVTGRSGLPHFCCCQG